MNAFRPVAAAAWSLAVMAVTAAVQLGYSDYYLRQTTGSGMSLHSAHAAALNGDLVAISCVIAMAAGLLALFTIVLEHNVSLAAQFPPHFERRKLLRWLGITLAAVAAMDGVMWLARGHVAGPPELERYRAAVSPVLPWFATVVVTPLFEEALFRGFLLPPLAATALGRGGAVALAAVIPAMAHAYDDPWRLGSLVVLGCLYGAARLGTGSLAIPFVMHVLANVLAMAAVALAG
jgi:membrane protease YdiL (CAAX protease family)